MLQSDAADLVSRIGVTEIDHDIGIFHGRFDGVSQIALRDDLYVGIVPGKIDNRFSHSAFGADEQHAHRLVHFTFSNASSVLRNRAWFASLISQRGRRTSPDIAPRHPSAVFIGTGLGSINKSLNSGSNLRCNV